MLPSILAKQLEKGIGEYIKTTFPMTNAPFQGSVQQMLQQPGAVQPTVRGTGNWDGTVKNAPEGYVFTRTITDDTQPGGPVQRTIEYVAPFDKCDREQDYETAWKFFEEKYGENK